MLLFSLLIITFFTNGLAAENTTAADEYFDSFESTIDAYRVTMEEAYKTNVKSSNSFAHFVLEESQESGGSCPFINSCSVNSTVPPPAPSPEFVGLTVILDKMAHLFQQPHQTDPTQGDKLLACSANELKTPMVNNRNADNTLKWQYFGSENGTFHKNPAIERCVDEDPYDPRFRPWYSAAATGPKDVLVIIDVSGSMQASNRIGLARDAAKKILDTLGAGDYFQMISFSSEVSLSGVGGSGDKFVRATEANKNASIVWINSLGASGSTNMGAAFEKGFEIIKKSRADSTSTSGCQTALLFLTDGINDDTSKNPSTVYTANVNADFNIRIFSYSLGDDADTSIPKDLACKSGGIWTPVKDGDDLGNAMASYYGVYAAGLSPKNPLPRWSSIYLDSDGLGKMVTGAYPVFDQSLDEPQFFGVVGIDIILPDILNGTSMTEQNLDDYLLARSAKTCSAFDISCPALEGLRAKVGDGNQSMCHNCPLEWWAILLICLGCVAAVSAIAYFYRRR